MKINLQISKRIDQSDELRKIYDLCDLKKKKKKKEIIKKRLQIVNLISSWKFERGN